MGIGEEIICSLMKNKFNKDEAKQRDGPALALKKQSPILGKKKAFQSNKKHLVTYFDLKRW